MTKSALCDPVELYPNNIPSHDAIDDEGRGEPLQDWDTRIVSCEKHICPGQLVTKAKLSPPMKLRWKARLMISVPSGLFLTGHIECIERHISRLPKHSFSHQHIALHRHRS